MSSKTESKPPGYSRHITKTEFWNELMRDVFGARKGGAIIFIDAENARKGVAKTSCAVSFARLLSRAFRYELVQDDMTLAGGHYMRRYQEQPGQEQPSVLVIDEFVGAGSGDARRAMSNQNIRFGRLWQLLRAKRVITLATLPDWNEIDPRLQKYADYRMWCRERPMGRFQPYKITVPFNSSSGASVRTKGLGYGEGTTRISFPNMDARSDPFYNHLVAKKNELIDANTWDADMVGADEEEEEEIDPDDLARQEAIKTVVRLREPWAEEPNLTYPEIAKAVEYSREWVGLRIREWDDGEHRDLVPDPTD